MKKHFKSHSILIFLLPVFRTALFIIAGFSLILIFPFRGDSLISVSKWWAILTLIVNIITIVIVFLLTRKEGIKYRDLFDYSRNSKMKLKEILFVIIMMLLLGMGGLWTISYVVYGYIPVTMIQPLPLYAAILVFLFLPITTVLAELPLYLGYCVPRLKAITNNEVISITYPLFFYALQHSFVPLIIDFKHILARFVMFIPLIIMIGIWYYRKKTILPLMIGHGLLDLMTAIQLLLVSIYPSIFDIMNSFN